MGAHVRHNSGNNEWYTPAAYIEAARLVMGGIDLDPASCETANRVVQAVTFYDADADGLTREWFGRVWMNPPYARPLITQFVDRLITEYQQGRVTAATVLVNNGTETTWGQSLLAHCDAACFPSRRVRFWSPSDESAAPLQGQMVAYFGPDVDRFTHTFQPFGRCMAGVLWPAT